MDFWNKNVHVSDSSSVEHQEIFTAHTEMVYVIQLVSRIRTELRSSVLILLASCQQTCMTYTIAVCPVKISWCSTKELSETWKVLFQKSIWENSASSWFYYKNLSRCTVTWTSNYNFIFKNLELKVSFPFHNKCRPQSNLRPLDSKHIC